jgi:hypothetical protein
MAPRRNKLPLLFLYLNAASTGGDVGQVAWFSRRSMDLVRFVSGGQNLALSWVVIASAVAVVFGVLQLGAWMMVGGVVPPFDWNG